MANTALNRTGVALVTNKSGGSLSFGAVVIIDSANAEAVTTTTLVGFKDRSIGVVVEPNGIANNAVGLVAFSSWAPQVNLNTAATVGQLIKTHSVAGQATPHNPPAQPGDFGIAWQATSTPRVQLFGFATQAGGSSIELGLTLAIIQGLKFI